LIPQRFIVVEYRVVIMVNGAAQLSVKLGGIIVNGEAGRAQQKTC